MRSRGWWGIRCLGMAGGGPSLPPHPGGGRLCSSPALESPFPVIVLCCCCVPGPTVPLPACGRQETVGPGGCREGAAARVPSAVCEDPGGRDDVLLPTLSGGGRFLTQGLFLAAALRLSVVWSRDFPECFLTSDFQGGGGGRALGERNRTFMGW